MDAPTLDDLLYDFDAKITNICTKLALLDLYNNKSQGEMLEINNIIGTIQYMFVIINELLQQQQLDFLAQAKRCNNLLQILIDQVDHIERNALPLHYTKTVVNNKDASKSDIVKSKETKTDTRKGQISKNNPTATGRVNSKTPLAKKSYVSSQVVSEDACKTKSTLKPKPSGKHSVPNELLNAASIIPEMEPLSQEEFCSIPKYMLGRFTINVLNEFIVSFNMTIREKYTFINSFTSQYANDVDHKRFQNYKSQETPETKEVYFCTVNDIKELSTMKNVSTIPKMLICLRHCKRVKEIRGNPPKLVRYALVT